MTRTGARVPVVLAIDLGGTSLRAGLVTADGAIVAIASATHRIEAEADAETWWITLRGLLKNLDARDVVGIGLSGFTRSQILVDDRGRPVRPAQTFLDGRATAEASELAGEPNSGWTEMSAYHPRARLLWVARHDPAAFARARHLLQPKDFLALRLTGMMVADCISNAWAIDRASGFPTASAPALLPRLRDPTDRIGDVESVAGLNGTPVFAGAMDTWCATIGAGALRDRGAYIISGTTDAAGAFSTTPVDRAGRVTLPWGENLFQTGGPSSAGADCAAWAAILLGLPDAEALTRRAAEAAGGEILFVPHLTGARAPVWNPAARGALLGLSRAHGPADLARAVLEGVALANRDLLDGLAFDRVVIAGGGARSDFWCQLRADALGVPLDRAGADEPGLVGAAATAWVGLGRFPNLAAAQAAMARPRDRFEPDMAAHARMTGLYRWFLEARLRSEPPFLSAALAGGETI